MRILVVGLGAIGQRHARNIQALRPGVELHAFRQRRLSHVVTDALLRDDLRDVEADLGVIPHETLGAALAARPDAVVICNPSALHLGVAIEAAEAGCHLFIEKPVSHTADGLHRLQRVVARKRLIVAMGCQWRFHPCVVRLQELLARHALGAPRKTEIHYAEYLPDWHPYEDYRTSYAARSEMGGGVVLTQIHDYDLAWWLFGPVRSVSASGGKLSDLEVDVEDTVQADLETTTGSVLICQSMATRPSRRSIRVDGSRATAMLDLLGGQLSVDPPVADGLVLQSFQRNEMFRAEMRDFLECVETGGIPRASLADGVAVLHVALAVKESMRTGRPVRLT
ncbi:MAG: Gfo/Idh/MocA family oxidoreductase [Gemmatimonadaceae bacterium]|nr:Gfo/Idh/MocA family oxidoreductase [Gemmatimonadaceae bacterium]